jgi:DNA invertase Pin-like site-specific DNA recombinase
MQKIRNAVVVRVSEQGDRPDEHFHSPDVQLDAAKRWSKNRSERVVTHFQEIDVSGKLPLARRPGLLAAIELVEAGRADQIVVAYFDRLVRSLKVQLEVIERVEKAGGEIFALDHGKLTNGTAATRLSTNMMGAVFQYFAEVTGEKVTAAQARAVARGVYPHPKIPVGYVRGDDGVLVVVPTLAKIVVEVFDRRDRGASLVELQAFLAEHGIERSIAGVASMLRSRMYLGEIHFGDLHNLKAHTPIIRDRSLFDRVQRRTVPRGRKPKSERLLARLGVLRCGTCGTRMVINTYSGSYRCGNTSARPCERPAAVKADRVEKMVMDEVRAYTADARGRAAIESHRREAETALERAERDLKAAKRRMLLLPDGEDDADALAVVQELAEARDKARELVDQLGGGTGGQRKVVSPADIDKLRDPAKRLLEWRGLITDAVESVSVAPAEVRKWDPTRIDIKFLGQ